MLQLAAQDAFCLQQQTQTSSAPFAHSWGTGKSLQSFPECRMLEGFQDLAYDVEFYFGTKFASRNCSKSIRWSGKQNGVMLPKAKSIW